MKFVDGRADEAEAIEALMIELDRQKERIRRVEREIAALTEEQEGRRKILEDFLRHLKEGAWRIENTLERNRNRARQVTHEMSESVERS